MGTLSRIRVPNARLHHLVNVRFADHKATLHPIRRSQALVLRIELPPIRPNCIGRARFSMRAPIPFLEAVSGDRKEQIEEGRPRPLAKSPTWG